MEPIPLNASLSSASSIGSNIVMATSTSQPQPRQAQQGESEPQHSALEWRLVLVQEMCSSSLASALEQRMLHSGPDDAPLMVSERERYWAGCKGVVARPQCLGRCREDGWVVMTSGDA